MSAVRLAIRVEGRVQGVGFRPFVWRAAEALGLAGWVRNGGDAVELEVEGASEAVRAFLLGIREGPFEASLHRVEVEERPLLGERSFEIRASARGGRSGAALPIDLAMCHDCRTELAAPAARRHRYPFTTCSGCGPRHSILEALPFDRRRTSMRDFPPCAACAAEYADPRDRRFHAQTLACPDCGPSLRLLDPEGRERAQGEAALGGAAELLRAGGILALQGLGGFQLLTPASDPGAVARLRLRKRRGDKPFAVLFASLKEAGGSAELSAAEAAALGGAEAPILLARRRRESGGAEARSDRVVEEVAPGASRIGVLLPYTPLHQLLVDTVAEPLVCTSGNLANDPIAISCEEALQTLGEVADRFLVHDRPILRPVEDSVARMGASGLELLRRARGFAPGAHPLASASRPVLALGAQQKATIAIAFAGEVVVSPHLGDLHSARGVALLEETVASLLRLLNVEPALVVCDLHPDYASSRLGERLATERGVPLLRVQHHHAHVAACLAEHQLEGEVLGLAWDGTGLGGDGTVWGGEALLVSGAGGRRVARLRRFPLPGGDRAARDPRRAAAGVLHALGAGIDPALLGLAPGESRVLGAAMDRGVAAPLCSSMGRLFDAVAVLSGARTAPGFEGQAAMALEQAAERHGEAPPYPFPLCEQEVSVADWGPLVEAVERDRRRRAPIPEIAARFHAALAALVTELAVRLRRPRVAIAGGCFQNALLVQLIRRRLSSRGIALYHPERFPPNDGGIALGQAWIAAQADRARRGTRPRGEARRSAGAAGSDGPGPSSSGAAW